MFEDQFDDWREEYEQDSANLLDLLDEIMSIEIKPEVFSIPKGAQLEVPAGQPLPQKTEDQTLMNASLPEIYLQILRGNQQGRKITVNSVMVVGRSESADVTLQDQMVSRSHIQIEPVVGGFQLKDLGSSNGTEVNGQNVRGSITVTPGDKISLGDTVLQVMGDTLEDYQATKRQKFCTKCGQPLKPGKQFCVKCGAAVD